MRAGTRMKPRMRGLRTAVLTLSCMLATATAALALSEDAKLTAWDRAEWDLFGEAVAFSGDTLVVGAPFDDDAGYDSGSVYVFVRTGTTWNRQAKFTASDASAGDRFGYSVALSGNTALIGSFADDDAGFDSGSAYVFTRTGNTWTQQAKLTASDASADDNFGFSVALEDDTAFIGAWHDPGPPTYQGSAYVFTRTGSIWTQQQKLTDPDPSTEDFENFGSAVAISGDTALIGATSDTDSALLAGSVFVYVRTGATWVLEEKLLASDAAAFDGFGWSVSLSGDTALIGAFNEAGAAYVFTRTLTGWSEQAKLIASDASGSGRFGFSVILEGDIAFVGSPYDDDYGFESGSAYIFSRTGTVWNEKAKLTASDGAPNALFGTSMAFSGGTLIVGATGGSNPEYLSGAAYVFDLFTVDPDSDGDGVPDSVDCNPNSDLSPTVVIGGYDTGVPNTLFDAGCTISDDIAAIADASNNHGQFVRGVIRYTNMLRRAGILTARQSRILQIAAAWARIP